MRSVARHRFGLTSLLLLASACAHAAPVGALAEGCRVAGSGVAALPATPGNPAAFPPPQLQVRTPVAPTAIPSGGRHYLIYELHLQNFSGEPMLVRGLEVVAADGPAVTPIATFEADPLRALVSPSANDAGGGGTGIQLAGNSGTIAFLCLAFDGEAKVPQTLKHRIALADGTVDGPDVEVDMRPLRVLAPPVSGPDWTAAGGPSNTSHHRRGPIVMNGTARISRRYALDWKRMKGGASFIGDARDVRAYHAYGQDVLAVADGTVVSTMDGLPDNVPRTAAGFTPAVPLTADNIAGNHVVLDLGRGQFAYYAHLQGGSISVKKGDRIRRGKVLGRIGNSGDSREPHLHFQLADGPHILAAEGLPHVIDRYRFKTEGGTHERRNELPVRGSMIDFVPLRRP